MPRVKILFDSATDGGACWSSLLRKMVRQALKAAAWVQDCEVSLLLVDDPAIRDLNLRYRNIDAVTDVLSFSMLEGPEQPGLDHPVLLGDVVISLETATRRAISQGVPLDAEMALLTVHGVLHLIGYDHQQPGPRRRMREREGAALAGAGIDPVIVGRSRPASSK